MPELPEVETISRQLGKKIPGFVLSNIQILNESIIRSPIERLKNQIIGKKILRVTRRGKYLGLVFGETVCWFHLGMTGQLYWQSSLNQAKHIHLRFSFEGIAEDLVYRDIRRFGHVFITSNDAIDRPTPGWKTLGKDPFEISAEAFIDKMKSRSGFIKGLLLNQKIVSGIGNIYADESLHRAKIHPRKRPRSISRNHLTGLLEAIRETLTEAIRCGGSSIDDYLDSEGRKGNFQLHHQVYAREGNSCLVCGFKIRRIQVAGRSTFFCSQCQK